MALPSDGYKVDSNDFPNFDREVYATVAFADEFAGTRLDVRAEFWLNGGLTDVKKNIALKNATQNVDELAYQGTRLYVGQIREFPRVLQMESAHDAYASSDEIPTKVIWATCIQAYYLAHSILGQGHDAGARQDAQFQGLSGVSRVGASESYNHSKARRHNLCREAYQLLSNFVAKTATYWHWSDIPPGG
jgi:hypothetical protein